MPRYERSVLLLRVLKILEREPFRLAFFVVPSIFFSTFRPLAPAESFQLRVHFYSLHLWSESAGFLFPRPVLVLEQQRCFAQIARDDSAALVGRKGVLQFALAPGLSALGLGG